MEKYTQSWHKAYIFQNKALMPASKRLPFHQMQKNNEAA